MGKPTKIKLEQKKMLLEWVFKNTVFTAEKIDKMLIYHEREVLEPRNNGIYISSSFVRRLLNDENMV